MAKKNPPKDNDPDNTRLSLKNLIKLLAENAHFYNLNLGSEGNPAAPVHRLDLQFRVIVDGEFTKTLAGSDEVLPLWNADRSVKYLGLGPQKSKAVLKEAVFGFGDLEFQRIEIPGVTVNKFEFFPVQGRAIELTLRVQIRGFTDEQLVQLSHAKLKKAQLSITCDMGVVMEEPKKDEDKQPQLAVGGEENDEPGDDARH